MSLDFIHYTKHLQQINKETKEDIIESLSFCTVVNKEAAAAAVFAVSDAVRMFPVIPEGGSKTSLIKSAWVQCCQIL